MYSDDFIEKMCTEGAVIGYAGDFHFPSETFRNHSGAGNVVINGHTYFGVGEFGTIGSVNNVGDANPNDLEVGLVGLPSDIFNAAMHGDIRGSKVEIFKVVFDPNGKVLATASVLVGQVTNYAWKFEKTGDISITVSDEFSLYERPLQRFYTHHQWVSENEGDNFWQYVAQMADKEIHWGAEQDGAKFTQN